MNIIEKIKAKSSKSNRLKGMASTVAGVVCTALLTAGVVSNPIGIAVLIVGATLFSAKAGHHALQFEQSEEDLLADLEDKRKRVIRALIDNNSDVESHLLVDKLKSLELQINLIKNK